MKKSGIINPELCEAIASLGHTDSIVICDAGLPIPPGVRRIDLSLVRGAVFDQVFHAIVRELQVEGGYGVDRTTRMGMVRAEEAGRRPVAFVLIPS